MPPEFLEATLAGERAAAEQILGMRVPEEWFAEIDLARIRLGDLQHNPAAQQWLLRAIRLRGGDEMIGHIGFHTPPDPEYLRPLAPGGIEIGYTIFPAYRRQGYAREAVAAVMAWAAGEHGVPRFVLSISPENEPSLKIARHFGFRKIGSHVDEEDGPEDVFALEAGNIPHIT